MYYKIFKIYLQDKSNSTCGGLGLNGRVVLTNTFENDRVNHSVLNSNTVLMREIVQRNLNKKDTPL